DGGVTFGIDKPRTYNDLDENEKKRFDANIQATNILLQGLPKDIYKLINYNTKAKEIWDNVKMLLAGSELTKEDRESQLYDEFERFKMILGEQANTYDVDVDNQPVQDMAQSDPNIFQADDCDALDSDVDDEPTTQTIFMANLS
nr:integrase, catalytic region, zinc finger, CCHC-type, peptidase aspartic, catalytic [Tanacetum cinerariifolium]